MKICTVCFKNKSLDQFNNQKGQRFGKAPRCRECDSISQKKYKQDKFLRELEAKKENDTEIIRKRFRDTDYFVYPDGRIFSEKRNRFMKGCINAGGYRSYNIRMVDKIMSIRGHRMVAECYIDNPNNYPDVNHINHIRSDNRVENLEWCTPFQNISHKVNEGRQALGQDVHNAKLKNYEVLEIKKMLRDSISFRKIAKIFNVTSGHIANIKSGKVWSHLKLEESNG